jgi:hypothetical protein
LPVIISTPDPDGLLQNIRAHIDQGQIRTWTYDQEGDFTHTPADKQWTNEAWMRPSIQPGCLVFSFVPRKDRTLPRVVYAIYHGRLIEMLLTHFAADLEKVYATPGL